MGSRIELRARRSTADLFIDDVEPFEIHEEANDDRKDFVALIDALTAGVVGVRRVLGLRGWKPSAIVWPTGEWELPGGAGMFRSFRQRRRDLLPKYS